MQSRACPGYAPVTRKACFRLFIFFVIALQNSLSQHLQFGRPNQVLLRCVIHAFKKRTRDSLDSSASRSDVPQACFAKLCDHAKLSRVLRPRASQRRTVKMRPTGKRADGEFVFQVETWPYLLKEESHQTCVFYTFFLQFPSPSSPGFGLGP